MSSRSMQWYVRACAKRRVTRKRGWRPFWQDMLVRGTVASCLLSCMLFSVSRFRVSGLSRDLFAVVVDMYLS